MATIEPRLIHLLNNATAPELGSTDLPPFRSLQSLPLPDTDQPLPPLDRGDANRHSDRFASSKRLPPHHLVGDDEGSIHPRIEDTYQGGAYAGTPDDGSGKKRNHPSTNRDDYPQLPQPFKKQKPAVHASVVPPIINGLHEPPPDAALFPPIASTSFRERDASRHEVVHSPNTSTSESANLHIHFEYDNSQSATRKRTTKPRRKWSEEETNHLLLGVSKHGVGKWRTILDDPQFTFNSRSAGDLKDRFRTCCPAELRDPPGDDGKPTTPVRARPTKPKKGLHSENILHDDAGPGIPGMITPPTESENTTKKKTRAHRKKMEDLESLGIHAPFKKSLRRERRPFTEQDDREILEGLERYGPAWTKILRDPNFHLSTRRPTDLRDRVRNRYPAIYQRIEKGMYQAKDSSGRSSDIMEPSVTMSIDNSLKPSNQISRAGSREELTRGARQSTKMPDRNTTAQSHEFADANASQWLGSEMGISRLLLDDDSR